MGALEKSQVNEISKKDHFNFIAVIFCFWFAIYIYAPVFGVYMQSIDFSYSTIGIILGSYGITQVLLRFPLGILSDRLQNIRKQLLVGSFVMALVSSLLLVFFDSAVMILIARLLAGVTASMWVMATVLYSYYFSADKSAKAMGILQFVTVATQFISMAISGYLVHLFGWYFPFWVGAAASILGIYFAWNIKAVHNGKVEVTKSSIGLHIKKTIIIPQIKMLTFLSLIAHAILFITIFGFSFIVADTLGVPEKSFIWLTCAFFIPHALASLGLVFYEMDSRYNKLVLSTSFGLSALFLVLVPLANSFFLLSVLHAGSGFTLGVIFPLLLSEVVRVSPNDLKMSAMGFFQSFYALGIFLGPLLAGMIAESFGLHEVFIFTGVLSLGATVVVILLFE
ncbi:MFS transporter [Sporosarcina sp. FSL K6-1522]|uniref:MFS transporter n=1 Tax=Sporosarcina sp. FSL K6-1522 TaxID=2921554 RepID=UPI00315AA3D0